MTNLDSLLESRDIALSTKDCIVKAIFIGRTDTEAETPMVWPPDVKN